MDYCNSCPRHCRTDREQTTGFCGERSDIRVARASLHMWEEPCISGVNGSGTVFFTGCVLKCAYCQNGIIASGRVGKSITKERLAEIFLRLQDEKAHNINLVTPTHFAGAIAGAIEIAKNGGLKIPVVYNTGNYESTETLKRLDGLIDIYLPDFKYFDSQPAKKYSAAPDYFERASKGLECMVNQVGTPQFDSDGMMKKGVIVRHLLLPGGLKDSMKVVEYLYSTYKDNIYISLMNQYTPIQGIEKKLPELAVRVRKKDYDRLVDYAIDLGVENGFIQEGNTAKESFIPDFDLKGI